MEFSQEDLDEEDLAILREVASKGYYHNRPKSGSGGSFCPQKLETAAAAAEVVAEGVVAGGRKAFDAFQAKWDRFDDDAFVEAVAEAAPPAPSERLASAPRPAAPPRPAAEFKVLVLGAKGVGKSALLLRHLTGEFLQRAFWAEVVPLKFSTTCGTLVFNMWELDGAERGFSQGQAAVLVFDVNSRSSWRQVPGYLQQLRQNCGPVPTVLVGNKADKPPSEALKAARRAFQQRERLQFYEVSAKEPRAVERPFLWLARRLVNAGLDFAPDTAALPQLDLKRELFQQHAADVARAAKVPVGGARQCAKLGALDLAPRTAGKLRLAKEQGSSAEEEILQLQQVSDAAGSASRAASRPEELTKVGA
ncbi:unnamed protein product [Effrenium voratum]|uniref:Uncharacterized protein n=1 Tax=Effrenium voratum TaxID=2562239 RepID=A0AA36JJA5_9DINO|nr:unnamed protein product [Effrenium voratum]